MNDNFQLIEKQELLDDGTLFVQEIWYTIQGEGPFAGEPATFVRLTGCNLQCRLCDTDYTSVREKYSVHDLVEKILGTRSNYKTTTVNTYRPHRKPLIVLTGGEPFRQNITPLVNELLDLNFRVQVETNGTLVLPRMPDISCRKNGSLTRSDFYVICSPKTPILHKDLVPYIDAFKYVVEHEKVSALDGLPISVLGMERNPARPPRDWRPSFLNGGVYVQPVDCKEMMGNYNNLQTAVDSCMTFGYTLCQQVHKELGLK